jgi:hypothetical protein
MFTKAKLYVSIVTGLLGFTYQLFGVDVVSKDVDWFGEPFAFMELGAEED